MTITIRTIPVIWMTAVISIGDDEVDLLRLAAADPVGRGESEDVAVDAVEVSLVHILRPLQLLLEDQGSALLHPLPEQGL